MDDSKELYEQIRANVKEWRNTKSISLANETMELLEKVLKEYE